MYSSVRPVKNKDNQPEALLKLTHVETLYDIMTDLYKLNEQTGCQQCTNNATYVPLCTRFMLELSTNCN